MGTAGKVGNKQQQVSVHANSFPELLRGSLGEQSRFALPAEGTTPPGGGSELPPASAPDGSSLCDSKRHQNAPNWCETST